MLCLRLCGEGPHWQTMSVLAYNTVGSQTMHRIPVSTAPPNVQDTATSIACLRFKCTCLQDVVDNTSVQSTFQPSHSISTTLAGSFHTTVPVAETLTSKGCMTKVSRLSMASCQETACQLSLLCPLRHIDRQLPNMSTSRHEPRNGGQVENHKLSVGL